MNDTKDDLEQKTDEQLNEIFATELNALGDGPIMQWPPFATDANAVLPWLEKESPVCEMTSGRLWRISLPGPNFTEDEGLIIAFAPTFARAACIALIRSKRAQKS